MGKVEGRITVQHVDARGRNVARLSSFSETPLRRLGLSMTRTTTPRRCASTTAAINDGSVKTNILMRSDLAACLMASRIGFAESSGKTTRLRDICALPPDKP